MAGNYTTNTSLTLLDGVNVRSYGFIEKATGFLDEPERKKTIEHSWPDDHGLDLDLSLLRRAERKCHLDLVVKGSNWGNLVTAIETVKALFNKPGYRYLKLYGINGVYLVYVSGSIGVSRLNRGVQNAQLARMSIPLVEPYPVKRLFYATGGSVALGINTTKPITIDWGDNSYSSLNSVGNVNHTYSATGEYCITIYGGVDGISGITPTNCTVIPVGGSTGPTGEAGPGTPIPSADSTEITVDDTTITVDQTL